MRLFRSTWTKGESFDISRKSATARKRRQNRKMWTNLSTGSEPRCTFRSQDKDLPRKRRCARPPNRNYDDCTCNRHVCENVTQRNDLTTISKFFTESPAENQASTTIPRILLWLNMSREYDFLSLTKISFDISSSNASFWQSQTHNFAKIRCLEISKDI